MAKDAPGSRGGLVRHAASINYFAADREEKRDPSLNELEKYMAINNYSMRQPLQKITIPLICFFAMAAQGYTENDSHHEAPLRTLKPSISKAFGTYQDPIFKGYPQPALNSNLLRIRNFRITVLSDMVINRKTHGEWGYSALVDGVDANGNPFSILFDTGAQTETVWYNIQKLRDPDDPTKNLVTRVCATPSVLLSHNHQDHVAGLLTLRTQCVKLGYTQALKTAYLGGPEAQWSRPDRSSPNGSAPFPENNYLIYPSGPGPSDDPKLGTVEEQYRMLGGTFIHAETPLMLVPGVWTSGKVFRNSPEKQYWQFGESGPMVSAGAEEFHDNVPEDHGLVLNTKSGLVVMTGCGHAGVVNVIEHARNRVIAGHPKVLAVVGGIHLFPANLKDLAYVAQGFKQAHVRYLLGSHCTGIESVMYLRQYAGLKNTNAVVGAIGTLIKTDPANDSELVVDWLAGPMINRDPSRVK